MLTHLVTQIPPHAIWLVASLVWVNFFDTLWVYPFEFKNLFMLSLQEANCLLISSFDTSYQQTKIKPYFAGLTMTALLLHFVSTIVSNNNKY